MINNYKYFLLENSNFRKGTKQISKEQLIDIIINNCKDFSFDDQPIWRGVNRLRTDEYYIIDPTQEVRKNNYYDFHNIFINNAPEWSEYPRRDTCILGIFDLEYLIDHYSPNIFRIIPFDNAEFGVCPKEDMIFSFPLILDLFSEYCNLKLYSGFELINDIIYFLIGRNINMTNLETFKNDIDILNEEIKNGVNYIEFNSKSICLIRKLEKIIDSGDNFYNWLKENTNPIKNGFEILNYKNLIKEKYRQNEVWTESKCLLIPDVLCDEIKNNVEKIRLTQTNI